MVRCEHVAANSAINEASGADAHGAVSHDADRGAALHDLRRAVLLVRALCACPRAFWMSALVGLTAAGAGRMAKTPSLSSLSTLAMGKGWVALVR